MATPDIEKMLVDEMARTAPAKRFPPLAAMDREFRVIDEDRYQFAIPQIGIVFEIDRVRRKFEELVGELRVRCDLPGARTVDGILSVADFSVSSSRSRTERAKFLEMRAGTRGQLDWMGLVEEFCQRVLEAERTGQPAVDLRHVPRREGENMIEIDRFRVPRRHPSILFSDGGVLKSYLALYFAGCMAEMDIPVMYCDWELDEADHSERLHRIFPDGAPQVFHVRCTRSLTYEADRLRRIARDNGIQYSIFDSIGYACDGAPESAEAAGKYFRAVRQIGGGSLHIAHISKAEGGDQKPFGSVFWHNSARATWYAERANEIPDGTIVRLGLFNRKANLGPLQPPLGYTVTFTDHRTIFRTSEVADTPELAEKLTVTQRVTALLRRGSMTVMTLAEELGVETNTVTQAVNRQLKKNRLFIVLEGTDTQRRIGLLERDRLS